MDSDSEHDHRDDESVASGPEEVEETKPKSALKKTREVLPPVERPELPYVLQSLSPSRIQ
jgi:translation initiation factor 2 subunit 3